jgi:DNA polymerase kappa
VKDKILTQKIERILTKKQKLENHDLSRELRNIDRLIEQEELSRDLSQQIVHVDCDAFYAAVEQLDRPELKDLPFAVGGGVITTCNYVARKYGCRSGMAGFVAKKLCPQLILIKQNFDKYNAKAREVREVLADYDPRFESASIDEAYLNITEYCKEKEMEPGAVVQQMRDEIHERTKITVSAGIAANAKLAKICSNMNKPNGQFILPNDRTSILAFMRDLSTRKVNGIGRVLERELGAIGVKTCGDLYEQRQFLNPLFGEKTTHFLVRCYLGLGRTQIQPAEEYERKSVGTETTFREISDPEKLREKLRWIADELEKDMKRAECKGRTLVLKIKLHTFEVYTRQAVMPKAIFAADDLYNHGLQILTKLEEEIPAMRLRLMGLRCTHLISTKKPDTMAFFGFRRMGGDVRASPDKLDNELGKRKERELDDDGWEQWPEDEFASPDDFDTNAELSVDTEPPVSPFRRHGKEVLPNPKPVSEPEVELWDCPICNRPQPPDEKLFNDHIDLCLSRRAIRDTVQAEAPGAQSPSAASALPDSNTKRVKASASEKKRGRPPSIDPRQKKLCFN